MQVEPLGMYKLLEECSRSHFSRILQRVGAWLVYMIYYNELGVSFLLPSWISNL
jgi:hypothetical protein